jgi:hypothetical protein
MFVEVGGDGEVGVVEGEDCKRLHLQATGLSVTDVGGALERAGVGRLTEDGDAFINLEWLHEAAFAASGATPDWPTRWEGMIAFAASSGWLSADGIDVRVHCKYD